MDDQPDLFRSEVSRARRENQFGHVLMSIPLPYTLAAMISLGLFITLIILMYFSEFHHEITAQGYLNTQTGLSRIYPEQPGWVKQCYVKQNRSVRRGDPLFLIENPSNEVHKKIKLLNLQIRSLSNEIRFKRQYLNQLKPLLKKKYIALPTYLEQYNNIKALLRTRHALNIQRLHSEKELSYTIHAPIDGTVSSLLFQTGQWVSIDKPLAMILPKKSKLIADVFVPVHKAAFLSLGNPVTLRYDAYPFHRFGVTHGHIQSIDQTSLTDADEHKPIKIDQPYYKVQVALEQTRFTHRPSIQLSYGMTFSAVILGAKTTVWQWLIAPLQHHTQGET